MADKKLDSSTDIYRGELMIFSGDDPIAFAKNATLEVTTEEIDISNKMMGNWAGSLPGKSSYTASSEALLTRKVGALSYDALLKKQIAGELLDFFFGEAKAADKNNFGGTFEKDETKVNFTGKVMITSLSITSENGQIASCSVSLKGVGALEPQEAVPAQG
ncbi:phage tail tube protein [Bacteroides reticulotermitis]|uniref:phage tail tube protein n=1 Tax=Bacteroides reticulotermitis TaxID=1133319 RepID=UPI003A88E49F